jgi:hypothetical protein
MIIADTWAYGHIARTGGDAIHVWFEAIRRPDWIIDPLDMPEKHQRLLDRPAALHKQLYAVSFRRLPNWTLSFLHELPSHPSLWDRYGFTRKEEICRPESALRYPFADEALRLCEGVHVTHWLRTEHLLADFLRLAEVLIGPLSAEEIARVKAAQTRGPGAYNHNVCHWWSEEEIDRIYALNPHWARIEQEVYKPLALSLTGSCRSGPSYEVPSINLMDDLSASRKKLKGKSGARASAGKRHRKGRRPVRRTVRQ